uniref:Uncharacterized protein n=1 Tax=Alexandrium catenella TaxID=2925 RepID=A0A7S1S1X4_ALECA
MWTQACAEPAVCGEGDCAVHLSASASGELGDGAIRWRAALLRRAWAAWVEACSEPLTCAESSTAAAPPALAPAEMDSQSQLELLSHAFTQWAQAAPLGRQTEACASKEAGHGAPCAHGRPALVSRRLLVGATLALLVPCLLVEGAWQLGPDSEPFA